MTEQKREIRGLPIISVIMPAYNSEKTIERAMLSVTEQSYRRTELIVVDSSSTDKTADAVRRFASEHHFAFTEMRVSGTDKVSADSSALYDVGTGNTAVQPEPVIRLIVKSNEGVSAARNAGIRAAGGRYFASLDADDYYEPHTIERLFEVMEGEEADVALGGMRKVYEGNEAANEELSPEEYFAGDIREFMDRCFTGLYDLHLISTHSNKLYRTGTVLDNSVFYNEKLAVNEDIDFVLRYLACCSRAAVVPDIFLNYVQHGVGESLINTFQPHGLEGALIVLRSCKELMRISGASGKTDAEMNDRLFVHICSFAGLMYYRSGYNDRQIREELEKLCSSGDFEALLSEMRPSGLKNRTACLLLKHKLTGIYHILCKALYRNTSAGTKK